MLKMLRICIWMKGKTDFQEYDLWGFRTELPFDQFAAFLLEQDVYIEKNPLLESRK